MFPPEQNLTTQQRPKLLDQVRSVLRTKHYSYKTEQSYIDWIKRFILFQNKRHPLEMGGGRSINFYPTLLYMNTCLLLHKTKLYARLSFFTSMF